MSRFKLATRLTLTTGLFMALSACATGLAAQDRMTATQSQAQHCLALALYFEARGESLRGQRAVGAVVLNRVAHEEFPNSVCGVVKQGGERPPCQFSWWCDGKSDYPKDRDSWHQVNQIAEALLDGLPDPTRGALYFHNRAIQPGWRLQRTVTIGAHVFYR